MRSSSYFVCSLAFPAPFSLSRILRDGVHARLSGIYKFRSLIFIFTAVLQVDLRVFASKDFSNV
jgi:hypothetical protein